MAKLESFANLTKMQKDLINKGFCFGQFFALGIYAKSLKNTVKISFRNGTDKNYAFNSFAVGSLAYHNRNFCVTQEITSFKSFKSVAEYVPENYKEFKGKIEVQAENLEKTGKIDKKSISIEYNSSKFLTKLGINEKKVFE